MSHVIVYERTNSPVKCYTDSKNIFLIMLLLTKSAVIDIVALADVEVVQKNLKSYFIRVMTSPKVSILIPTTKNNIVL